MLRVLPILVIAGFALYSFFDVLATDRSRFRSISKTAWLVVALIPVVGAILWFLLGRPQRDGVQDPVIHLRHRRERPPAPDDDPAFLRSLEERAWRAKREAKEQKPSNDSGPEEASEATEADSDGSDGDEAPSPEPDVDRPEPPTGQ